MNIVSPETVRPHFIYDATQPKIELELVGGDDFDVIATTQFILKGLMRKIESAVEQGAGQYTFRQLADRIPQITSLTTTRRIASELTQKVEFPLETPIIEKQSGLVLDAATLEPNITKLFEDEEDQPIASFKPDEDTRSIEYCAKDLGVTHRAYQYKPGPSDFSWQNEFDSYGYLDPNKGYTPVVTILPENYFNAA